MGTFYANLVYFTTVSKEYAKYKIPLISVLK